MEIKAQLKQFFKDNFMVEFNGEISDSDSFLENGVIDSTGVLELVLFLEETFEFKVGDDEIIPENLDTFDNIEAFVKTKTS